MFKRTDIPTRKLADGSTLTIPVFTFEGKNPNTPRVYIQSSIHGAEVQGNGVILHLIDHFTQHPPQGTVVLVPNANPFAINQRLGDYGYSRFDPATGENWNRLYANITCRTASEKQLNDQIVIEEFLAKIKTSKTNNSIHDVIKKLRAELLSYLDKRLKASNSYAQKLALQVQRMASDADIVLDLHCDTVSLPHVYTPSYAVDAARELNLPYLISIREEFKGALDEAIFCPWSNLATVWNNSMYPKPHIEALTVELGGQELLDLAAAKQQALGIIHYLSTKQVCNDVPYQPVTQQYVCALNDVQSIYSPQGGYISQFATLGKIIEANEPLLEILQINDLDSKALTRNQPLLQSLITVIRASTTCIPIIRCCSATVHEGMVVMKVMKEPLTFHKKL